jgi:hypothetical protein
VFEGSSVNDEMYEKSGEIIFWIILSLSIFMVLVSVCGIITSRVKTCCTIGCYSFLSMTAFFLFAIGGILAFLVNYSARSIIDNYCALEEVSEFNANIGRNFVNLIDKADKAGNNYLDQYMCSYSCPCIPIDFSKWGSQSSSLNSSKYNFNGNYSTFN